MLQHLETNEESIFLLQDYYLGWLSPARGNLYAETGRGENLPCLSRYLWDGKLSLTGWYWFQHGTSTKFRFICMSGINKCLFQDQPEDNCVWSENYVCFSYLWESSSPFLTITASNGHDDNRARNVVFGEQPLCSSWSKVCKEKRYILQDLLLLWEETNKLWPCAHWMFSLVYSSLSANHDFLMSDVIEGD